MKDVIQGLAREKGMSVNAYIQDLVRRGKLHPVLTLKNNFLFLKEDILRSTVHK